MPTEIPLRSVKLTSFACPHCGAHAAQTWYDMYGQRLSGERATPFTATAESLSVLEAQAEEQERAGEKEEAEGTERVLELARRMFAGEAAPESSHNYVDIRVWNLHVSRCYTCDQLAVWLGERLLHPFDKYGVAPNVDLPAEVKADFEEARTIVDLSPRGAAALLRLAVQKLCVTLGETGENINDDIAALVKKGLNPVVQQALDAVRVIGNEAVHPGQMDISDDRSTVEELFALVNFIADQMISQPKAVQAIYAKLPASKVSGIQRRDAP